MRPKIDLPRGVHTQTTTTRPFFYAIRRTTAAAAAGCIVYEQGTKIYTISRRLPYILRTSTVHVPDILSKKGDTAAKQLLFAVISVLVASSAYGLLGCRLRTAFPSKIRRRCFDSERQEPEKISEKVSVWVQLELTS